MSHDTFSRGSVYVRSWKVVIPNYFGYRIVGRSLISLVLPGDISPDLGCHGYPRSCDLSMADGSLASGRYRFSRDCAVATQWLAGLPPFFLALTLMILLIVGRIGFTYFTAMIATVMPVVFTFARGTHFNLVWIGMIGVVASTIAYLFPAQSISNMAMYVLGYYSNRDMIIAGGILTCIVVAITLLEAFFYWPFLGITVYK